MLSDATLTADIIKRFAKNAVDSTMPFSFHYGTVKSTDPIEIEVEQKLILTENDLIFTTLVQDFDVDMYMEHEVEETDLIHKHDIKIDTLNAGNYPCTSTHTITVQDSPDADKHIHEYKGVKTFTVNLKLAKDEKVLLLRIQGGQKFLVLDRVRTLNDTEFTDEFEGSGSSGSSGSGSSGSGSGSNSGNTSSGGNSGSTDSGNGGNDSGSTDNGNNSGGSVSDVISVTALMTALLSLTDEQKKEIGLTGVTIDDENITDETVYSSKKTTDELNNKVDKVEGKELSSNDFTDEEKTKLSELNNYDDTNLSNKVTELESTIPSTIASEISKIVAEAPENFDTLKEMSDWITEHEDSASAMNSAIQSNKTDIETEIAERKSADTSLQNQINNKVDKVSGKGLSTNDFTNEDKNKLADIKGVNLSNVYYYTAETGVKYYWYKIIDSSIFNATNRYIKLKFKLASDNNHPLKAEYILDVSHYLSTTKNLSVSLKNIYADKDSNDSNIIIAVDENYNVYAQFCCQWQSYVNITKEFGNINFISEKLNYASFNGEITNITPKQKVTRQGKFVIRKNLTSGVYTVDSVTDTISYGISSKAIADGSGNNIESTYLKKTDIDTSMNTESTNPVQNKVVTTKINAISDGVVDLGTRVINLSDQISSLGNKVYTCSTASDTKYKTISIPNIDEPAIGTCITVVFTKGNSIAKPTLGINGTSEDEIRMEGEDGTLIPFTTRYGSSTTAPYSWQSNTPLELYYNGTYWIVLNNPVVLCKKTRTAGTSSSSPSYKVYANGYKEIKGLVSLGNISKGTDIDTTCDLPILMGDTMYHVSLTCKQGTTSITSGEEMTYYAGQTYLKIHFYNRNSGTTMNSVYIDWMIQGY